MKALQNRHQDLVDAQRAKDQLEKRAKDAEVTLGKILTECQSKRETFEKEFTEGKQRLIKMDEAIRENLQKANLLNNDLAKTNSEISTVEKNESELRSKIATRQAEIEKLVAISEELESKNQAMSSKLQVDFHKTIKYLLFSGLELENWRRSATHQVH